jgi:thioredoxin-related protein
MMKKYHLIILGIALLSFTTAFSQDSAEKVKWYTMEEAEKLYREEPKKWLIDVYTDWCSWCKVMDQKTFSHPVIAQFINENFYAVKLNAESKESITFNGTTFGYQEQGGTAYQELAIGLLQGKMSFPSIAYLNEKLQLLGAVPGYKTPEEMEPLLNYILEDKYTSQTLVEYQETFTSKIK